MLMQAGPPAARHAAPEALWKAQRTTFTWDQLGGRACGHFERHPCKGRSKVRLLLYSKNRDGNCMSSLHKLSKANPEAPAVEESETLPTTELDTRTRALVIVALGMTIFLLHFMSELLAPLAFGLLLFYALDPAVDWLERFRVPRSLA